MTAARPRQVDLEELIAAVAAGEANQKSTTASTVSRQSRRQRSTVEKIFAVLDAKRIACGITGEDLCRLADISLRTWQRMRAGSDADPRTLRRLSAALDAATVEKARPGPDAGQRIAELVWSATAIAALRSGADPEAILAQDFSVQKPLNPAWLEAARIRRTAIHVVVVELDCRRVDVAAALGMTRQNVHQALGMVRDMIEAEPSLGELVAGVARLMKGQAA
jgi:hypothetical protein